MQIDPEKLVEARQQRAMSQEEAAIATDLSARTIQRIEAGQPASLESTKALLTIFGADIIHDPDTAELPVVQTQGPWQLLSAQIARASRRTASLGFDGLRLLFASVFLLTALSKPFRPDQTGLYVENDGFTLGVLKSPPAGVPDMLGYWIVPLMLVAAALLLLTIGRVRRLAQPFR